MNKKRLMALILGITIVGQGFTGHALAEGSKNNITTRVSSEQVTYENFTKNEAGTAAIIFIANDIQNNSQSEWNENTEISNIETLYGYGSEISGYCIELKTGQKTAGYVIVSSDLNKKIIQEFSYSEMPFYKLSKKEKSANLSMEKNDSKILEKSKGEKVVYLSPFSNYVGTQSESFKSSSINDKNEFNSEYSKRKNEATQKNIDQNRELKKTLNETGVLNIEEWKTGSTYDGQYKDGSYVVVNLTKYLNDKYDGNYTQTGSKLLSPIWNHDQDNFGSKNDCSLVSIAIISEYYKNNSSFSKSKIPAISDAYDDILEVGEKHGYTPSGGTNPTKIDNIVEDSFSKWGYSFSASNSYVWSFNTFKSEIDSNRPCIFNIATGTYSNHTIVVSGYKQYDVNNILGGKFLQVLDNWQSSKRYIDYNEFAVINLGSVTKVKP